MSMRNGIRPRSFVLNSGFTVVEFVVALVLIAIGLVLAFPSLQTLSANNQVVAASNAIVSGMNLARSSAITLGENITICPSSDAVSCAEDSWNGGWIVFNDADTDDTPDEAEIIRVISLEGRLAGSGYGDDIVFRSDGTTSMGSDAVITNCYADPTISSQCLDITVSVFGMIQSTPHGSSPVSGGETNPGGTTGL